MSIILPARNEAASLSSLLPAIRESYPEAEIIVVNDGSDDDTVDICNENNVKVINHPYPKGNGAAVKTGARAATGDILVFMDADGQHSPADISKLVEELEKGFDMVVGSRSFKSHATVSRGIANRLYNWFASWMTGHKIPDLTSGFRIVHAGKFRSFLQLLPNGFSYPTTITMAMFRTGYSVSYVPIQVDQRSSDRSSHIRPLFDGIRFLLIIFRIGTLYSPLKLFVPISFLFFINGLGYYIYTYLSSQRFTNMSMLLFVTSILIFLIGLISEQLTMMLYKDSSKDN
ncbi:MAG: glycosyltransferase family 2 protein [Nitrososphaeraceae archaeon]|nr:glycosyltransferase family 2 protein [Nitrososphaeraceae archaeon]